MSTSSYDWKQPSSCEFIGIISCSRQKFEFIGILCSHAIEVLNLWNKIVIPPNYILKRWTKDAQTGCILDSKGCITKEDTKLTGSKGSKDLCRHAVEIANKVIESEVAWAFFARKLVELSVDIDKILTESCVTPNNGVSLRSSNPLENEHVDRTIINGKISTLVEKQNASQAKGIKKKDGVSRVKGRPKSCVERKSKKKRLSQMQTSMTNPIVTMPTSAPSESFFKACQGPSLIPTNFDMD